MSEVRCRRLTDQVIIVTGAATGIGKAIAIRLAAEGAAIAVADLQEERGLTTVREIETAGGMAKFLRTDVADQQQVDRLVASTVERFGRIDALVNNAGIPGQSKPAHEADPADFRRVIDVNLTGMFLVSRAVLPHLLEQGRGVIVNIASTFGMIGAPNSPAYAASKGGVIAFTRQLAVQYGPDGIRVNAVSPGYVDNDMSDRRTRMTPEAAAANLAARDHAAALQPLGRQADTSEIAAAVAFLVSDDASFVTGALLPVDGGCTAFFNLGERG